MTQKRIIAVNGPMEGQGLPLEDFKGGKINLALFTADPTFISERVVVGSASVDYITYRAVQLHVGHEQVRFAVVDEPGAERNAAFHITRYLKNL